MYIDIISILSICNIKPEHDFGVFEVGMNRPNEINKLSKLINPDILLIQFCTNDVDSDYYEIAKRNINMNQGDLIQEIPANDDFWIYFNENIYPMSAGQKLNFMNS